MSLSYILYTYLTSLHKAVNNAGHVIFIPTMTNFLKSLFKPESRSRRRAGPLPPDVAFSPISRHQDLPDDELRNLAEMLHRTLGGDVDARGHIESLTKGENDGMLRRLLEAMEEVQAAKVVTPFSQSAHSESDRVVTRAASLLRRARKGKDKARGSESNSGSGAWAKAYKACASALGGPIPIFR